MFRFAALKVAQRSLLPVRASPAVLAVSLRWNTPSSAGEGATAPPAQQGNNPTPRSNYSRARINQASLPPAFDVVHWNTEDPAKGHLLRVLHRDSYVVLDYYRQAAKKEASDGPATGNRAERTISVSLPPVYVARLLGVLEGRTAKTDIQLRYAIASFTAKEGQSHQYTLQCRASRPPSQPAAKEEEVEWVVDFDAAESLLLHRFLTQCLQYNTGFCRVHQE